MKEQSKKRLVSSEMFELRKTLFTLNRFLWTTELSYGYTLIDPAGDFSVGHKKAKDVLGRVTQSQVWYPTRQGQIRFDETVDTFLSQVANNTHFVYRSVIVFFLSSFEEYLKKRVGARRIKTKGGGWGPYLVSLSGISSTGGNKPVHLQTLLCADFCRETRNIIAHEPSASMPSSIDDKKIQDWRNQLANKNNALAAQLSQKLIYNAKAHFFSEAVANVQRAWKQGRTLPIEFFYMLSTLANLDKLALEIEQALPATAEMIPINQKPRRVFVGQAGRPIVA